MESPISIPCKCGASGFAPSRIPGQCEFCDGTFSGNPPTDQEVMEALELANNVQEATKKR